MSDISQIIGVVLQLGFWFTPIFWNLEMVPKKYIWFFKINPMYYVIQGYRDSIIYKIGFWEKPFEGILFFIISTFILFIGVNVFKRLRPHFNDVI